MKPCSFLPARRPVSGAFGGFALALFLVVFLAACHRTTYSTHALGHNVVAHIEGDTRSIETLPTRAVIRGGAGAVTIERDRVRIDDNPWTAIPAGVGIEVTIGTNRVRVVAGRVTIERTVSG